MPLISPLMPVPQIGGANIFTSQMPFLSPTDNILLCKGNWQFDIKIALISSFLLV